MRERNPFYHAIQRLEEAGIDSARLDAELLLAHLFQKDRLWLYQSGVLGISPQEYSRKYLKYRGKSFQESYVFTEDIILKYESLIARRVLHEPTSFILGRREFYGRSFIVNKDVLIPRPETEELVEFALLWIRDQALSVLDLGCGSGCIGLTLLLERPKIAMLFSDVSPEALEVCRKNQKLLMGGKQDSYDFHIMESYLFEKISGKFHLIICNLPYVTEEEYELLHPEVKDYEPKKALLCSDPHRFYRLVFLGLKRHLHSNGIAILETSPSLAILCVKIACRLFDANTFAIHVEKDLSKKNRFVLLRFHSIYFNHTCKDGFHFLKGYYNAEEEELIR